MLRYQGQPEQIKKESHLVVDTDEIICKTFHRFGSFTWLDTFVIETNQDSLLRLYANDTGRSLLAVDAAVVGSKDNVAGAAHVKTVGTDTAGVLEGLD